MIDPRDHTGWEWFDSELKHPEGRAVGGEPCVRCGCAIPPEAHWKHRDRHVCSSRCNTSLRRIVNREIRKGARVPPAPDAPALLVRPGMVFHTHDDTTFPFDFLGSGPRIGDVVERHGSMTAYLPSEPLDWPGGPVTVALCVHLNTGATAIVGCSEDGVVFGGAGRAWFIAAGPDGSSVSIQTPFEHEGHQWVWTWETISDLDPDGQEYTWTAPVCQGTISAGSLWTPAFRERSDHRNRVSASTARHGRRVRLQGSGGAVERIDPRGVFDRDGWICQLCHRPIEPSLRHPDPGSASLDHRVPLAAGGTHTMANVWASHLQCNLRKGARQSHPPSGQTGLNSS